MLVAIPGQLSQVTLGPGSHWDTLWWGRDPCEGRLLPWSISKSYQVFLQDISLFFPFCCISITSPKFKPS